MVSLVPLRSPVTGIGSVSSGPTHPVTLSPVCFSDALPFIAPSYIEIVISQFPVTSTARATNGANNNILSNPSRLIMLPFSTPSRQGRFAEHRRSSKPYAGYYGGKAAKVTRSAARERQPIRRHLFAVANQ